MKRIHIYLPEEYLDYLRKINVIPISEHIRKAIEEYINKLQNSKVSESSSKGGNNG